MQNKENLHPVPPKKQGILYQITTGKNNGPYLPKDISFANHKSLKLLTKEAQQSHKSYVDTLKLVEKQDRESKGMVNLTEVESFCQNWDFDIKYVKNMRNSLAQCATLTKTLTHQLQTLSQTLSLQNLQLHECALPALKSLKQKIKQNKEQQSANYSKMHRELEKIQQCFSLVAGGIRECQRKFVGAEGEYRGERDQGDE